MLRYLLQTEWLLPKNQKAIVEYLFLIFDTGTESKKYYANQLSNAFGDVMISCPTSTFAERFSKIPDTTVYMYMFDHKTANSKFGDWFGSPNYEEVQYIFGLPLRDPTKYTASEIELSKRLMQTWSHFADTGYAIL